LGLRTTLLINEHSKAGYKASKPHDKTTIKKSVSIVRKFGPMIKKKKLQTICFGKPSPSHYSRYVIVTLVWYQVI